MIQIQLPQDLEDQLRRELGDLDQAAKEALLLQAFREDKLSHHELSQALGLDRFETDAFLKEHRITEDLPTLEELEVDRQTLRELLDPSS
jgi:hypothetical protein